MEGRRGLHASKQEWLVIRLKFNTLEACDRRKENLGEGRMKNGVDPLNTSSFRPDDG